MLRSWEKKSLYKYSFGLSIVHLEIELQTDILVGFSFSPASYFQYKAPSNDAISNASLNLNSNEIFKLTDLTTDSS